MEGRISSLSTLPESLSFDHGSASSDGGIDSQVSWTSLQTSTDTRLSEYRILPSETNSRYLHHVGHEGLNGEWSLGESSSGAAHNQADQSERKREHTWGIQSRTALNLEERQNESSNILSLDSIDVNGHVNQSVNVTSIPQISGPEALSQDLNVCSAFRDHEDECRVIEHPNTHISVGSSNEKMPSTGSSSDAFMVSSGSDGYRMEDSGHRPGSSHNRRISCKRKALEMHVGQSSGAGSSNSFELAGRSQWHALPTAQNSASRVSMSTQAEHNLVFSNGSEQANSGIQRGVGGAVFSPSARRPAGSSRRNVRLCISGSRQQDHISGSPLSTGPSAGNPDVSSSRRSSRLVLRNRLYDINPTPVAENGSSHSQSVLSHVPSVRRNHQSSWSGASSSRTSNSPASAISVERERDAMHYEESASGSIPRSISEHPMFVPASEMGSSPQQPMNWNLAGGSSSAGGNLASASRAGSASGVNPSSSAWSHPSYPQHPRRLSEIVRRSLLSSVITETGGQSSTHAIRSSSPVTSQEMAHSSGSGNHGHHLSNLRSALLERHLDGGFGIPYSHRSLSAASEGRSSITSEQIRHVLDLMRRGEGLRIEDLMMLNHSVFSGMTDMHDRHGDMRMDVDNMSYEELLALGERIGHVSTGLNEETILSSLKQRKYSNSKAKDEDETEPCCICREGYIDSEDMGILECGHDFHRDCIKQWLMHKNLCPICKSTGLNT